MVGASLASYDGSAGTLVDTNVWVDCIDEGSAWRDWAVEQLQACSQRSPLHVNHVVFTELLVPGPDISAPDALLDVYEVQRTSLPWACASLTAAALAVYRKRGGAKQESVPGRCSGAPPATSTPRTKSCAWRARHAAGSRTYASIDAATRDPRRSVRR